MSTPPIGPSVRPHGVPRKPSPRKPPAKRLFSGVVGSTHARLDEMETPAQAAPVAVAVMEPPAEKSSSAIRAAKWREKQKKRNPGFDKQEAERKRDERAEIDRIQQIEDTLRENPNPPFVLKDWLTETSSKVIVTGGYDSTKIEQVSSAHEQSRHGRRVKPKGYGSKNIENTTTGDLPVEFDSSFAEKWFKKTKTPREVRVLHEFIRELTKKSPMLVCLLCKQQLAPGNDPGDNIAAGYLHFMNQHPESFKILYDRLRKIGCQEDHEGMARRYGNGTLPVHCGRCRNLLYKPPGEKSKGAFGQSREIAA
jgi:hypothetical protein